MWPLFSVIFDSPAKTQKMADTNTVDTTGGAQGGQQTTYIVQSNDLTGISPPTFNWNDPNAPQSFKSFRRYCELILKTPTYVTKTPEDRVNYILLWLGPQGVQVFDSWTITAAQRQDPDYIWDAFQRFFEPKSNFRLSRFMLRDMKQSQNESADEFYTRLREQAQKCNLSAAQMDDNILDQLIYGTAHKVVQKQLLEKDPKTLTLNSGLDIARTYEATKAQLQVMGSTRGIDAIKKSQRYQSTPQQKKGTAVCPHCGLDNHNRVDCPASGQKCNKCGYLGHWGSMCKSQPTKGRDQNGNHGRNHGNQGRSGYQKSRGRGQNPTRQHNKGKEVHSVEPDDDPIPEFDDMTFNTVECFDDVSAERESAYATLQIKMPGRSNSYLKGKVDTGAQGNILPMRTYHAMFPDDKGVPTRTSKSAVRLRAYNGTTIPQYGTLMLQCRYGDTEWISTKFYVADTPGPVIFGLRTCEEQKLVKMNCAVNIKKPIQHVDDLKQQYPECFTGIGKFPGVQKLTVDTDTQPVIHAPRRAPIQLRDKIKAELTRMELLGVIKPITEPTDWVSSITYVQKQNGDLRICIDPKDLNAALKRGRHHIPTIEELTHRFSEATIFSKLDAKSGYWAVQLDGDSQRLTTFNSPFGRYCFTRLPFGLKISQDVFQHAMDQILQDLPGVVSIADDIVVYGKDQADHDKNLHSLMVRAAEKGLVFNASKCAIKAEEVQFFGSVYSAKGVRPNPTKVQAITELQTPTSVKELQSFLGMVTYLGPYIPGLSGHTAPLRKLLGKEAEFQWHHEHQAAFEDIKSCIQSASYLTYFNPNVPAVLQVDASQEALGAALIQDGKPVAYASKSLTDTEKRYANIERELLACVFGAERFHTYLYGKGFTIESDHKPLEMISRKNLTAAPARLQRMLLRLQRYDYEIKYRPGREMVLADSLSRLAKVSQDEEIAMDVKISFIQFSYPRVRELREETDLDTELSILKKNIVQGFPEKPRDVHQKIRKYWNFRDELAIEDGIILKGEKVVVPQSLRDDYMKRIHDGHQGITRCQQRARSSIYWPGINEDIKDTVEKCQKCQQHQVTQPKEPLEKIEYPRIAWHTLSTDLFHYESKNYVIICDYYSKYPIIAMLSDISSHSVAEFTSKVFSMFGLPTEIISDNGPQFIGHPYQELMNKMGIVHTTSSPHHPRSHGFIERQIRTVKGLIKKSPHNTDMALLSHRTTPLGANQLSPAELLFGRKLQNTLPVHNMPPAVTDIPVTDQQPSTREKVLPELQPNQAIYYQDVAKRTWSPGTVIGVGPEPRSYTIQCSTTGRYLRRNRQLLRPRRVTFTEDKDDMRQLRASFMEPSQTQVRPQRTEVSDRARAPEADGNDTSRDERPTRTRKPTKRLINEM